MIKKITIFLFLVFIACDIPEEIYENPLDIEANAENGINPPALVFNPNKIETSTGSNVSLKIFVLEIDSLAGSFIRINYDQNKLAVNSISIGEFLQESGQNPIFFYEDNSTSGYVDIYTSFLGESEIASGTGTLAYIVFNIQSPGQSSVSYGSESELVNKNDIPIQLNGLGEVVVNAQ